MQKTFITITLGLLFMIKGCTLHKPQAGNQNITHSKTDNILLKPSPLQDQAPEFDKIKASDFLSAFDLGIKLHQTEITNITNNSDIATFDNTIVAMERSGILLTRTGNLFFNLSQLMSNDEMLAIKSAITPQLTAHNDDVYLNKKLFQRIKHIHDNRASLNKIDQRLTEKYYTNFIRAGVDLSEADKNKIRAINKSLAKTSADFSRNLIKSFNKAAIIVTDKEQLDGLSASEIASLATAAKSANKKGYMITLANTSRQPILKNLHNRQLRKKVWQRSINRTQTVNGPLAIKIAKLRAEKAQLLGFSNWAAYSTANQMAKTPGAVFAMLDQLVPAAIRKVKKEADDIRYEMNKDNQHDTLQPWDWAYYAERVRQHRYNLDDETIKPYFEFNQVLEQGLFYSMNRLYGISLKARTDLPVWHDDVLVYEVFDNNATSIGIFYLDPYSREGKAGGAWMSEFVTQSTLLKTKPVVYNVLNIPKPAIGQPTLMTFDEVTTLFHEFGHALHGLFSQVKYPGIAGTATARDFVEFPSQVHEDWAVNPDVIAHYARHFKTGDSIPAELLNKILASYQFNKGYDTTEYLAAALLDMEWHTLTTENTIDDIQAFQQAALQRHGIDFKPVPPRYDSTYFSHIFSGGYSAGYYAYLWTEVLAADAFLYMSETGGLTRQNGDRFRKTVLSRGNSHDLMQNYIDFRGKKPSIDALIKRRGLID